MNYVMTYKAPFPMAEITLNRGDEIRIEPSSMSYCDASVNFDTKLNRGSRGGGILSAIGRAIASGESMFILQVSATRDGSVVALGTKVPGEIHVLKLGAEQWRMRDQVFLACDAGVNYDIRTQRLDQAIFGNTGGLFVMETNGTGDMLIRSCGAMHRIELDGTKSVIVDNSHVVAWSTTLDYNATFVGGRGMSWIWDGIVCEFRGRGTVLMQTNCRVTQAKSSSD